MTERFAADIVHNGRDAQVRLVTTRRDLFAAPPELARLAPIGGDTLILEADYETVGGTVVDVDDTGLIRVRLMAALFDPAKRVTIRKSTRFVRPRCLRPAEASDVDIAIDDNVRRCPCDACARTRRLGPPGAKR